MVKYVSLLVSFFVLAAFSATKAPTPYTFPILNFFPKMPSSPLNPATIEGADLGRHLFYDPILSADFSMSCATCHKQEYAFSDAPNKLTMGSKKILSKRNTMPLFNLAWYPSYFWDGKASSIEDQVFHPLRDSNEMNLQMNLAVSRIRDNSFYKAKFKDAFGNQEIDSILISKSIGQFLRTLISYQSKYDRVLAGKEYLNSDEFEGLVLMNDMTKGDCLHCHTTDSDALGTKRMFSNNGLDNFTEPMQYPDKGLGAVTGNLADYGKFRIPSLRNVALTAPYMHDGRFATLDEVMDFYSEGVHQSVNIDSKMGLVHQGGVRLTQDEKRKIIAFLNALTDSAFISNAEFSNPFN